MKRNNFDTSGFISLCSPDWVAKTYGEYMVSSAQIQADLLAIVSGGITDDVIDEAIQNAYVSESSVLSKVRRLITKLALLPWGSWSKPGQISVGPDLTPSGLLSNTGTEVDLHGELQDHSYDATDPNNRLRALLYNMSRAFPLVKGEDDEYNYVIDSSLVDWDHMPQEHKELLISILQQVAYMDSDLSTWLPLSAYQTYTPWEEGVYTYIDWIKLYSINLSDFSILHGRVREVIRTYVTGQLNDLGISSAAKLPTADGLYVSALEYLSHLIQLGLATPSGDSLTVATYDFSETFVDNRQLDYSAEVTSLKSNMTSALAWGLGFVASSAADVPTAIATFEASIQEVISDASASFAASIASVKSVLSQSAGSVLDFFEAAKQRLGFNKIEGDEFTSPIQTDEFEYTGASPLTSVAVAAGKGLGGAVVAVAWTIDKIFKGAAWIFNKAKTALQRVAKRVVEIGKSVLGNPTDIRVIDSSSENRYFDAYNSGKKGYTVRFRVNPAAMSHHNDWKVVLANLPSELITVETIFGIVKFRINKTNDNSWYTIADYHDPDHENDCMYLTFNSVDMLFKLQAVDANELVRYGLIAPASDSNYHYSTLGVYPNGTTLNDVSLMASNSNLTPIDEGNESYVYTSALYSLMVAFSAGALNCSNFYPQMYQNDFADGAIMSADISDPDDSSLNVNVELTTNRSLNYAFCYVGDWGVHSGTGIKIPTQVSNIDCIRTVSGANERNSLIYFDKFRLYGWPGEQHDFPACILVAPYISLFLMQRYIRAFFPADYPFLPYSLTSYSFNKPRYKINTDGDNVNELAAALSLAAAVGLVVIIAITTIVIAKWLRARRVKKLYKYSSITGQLDNDMWNKVPLSAKDQKRYYRYKRKLEKLDILGGGLSGGAGVIEKLAGVSNNVQCIASNVAGVQSAFCADQSSDVIAQDMSQPITTVLRTITG